MNSTISYLHNGVGVDLINPEHLHQRSSIQAERFPFKTRLHGMN